MSRFALVTCVLLVMAAATLHANEKFTVRERVKPESAEISFNFKDVEFSEVVAYIAKMSGRNIIVDGEIKETVTLKLVGVNWRQALDMACQQINAIVEEESDDIIRISQPLTITFETKPGGADLSSVVTAIAKLAEATVIIGPNVDKVVKAQFYDVPWTKALEHVVSASGYVLLKEGKVYRIMDPATLELQLVTRVFRLRYIQPPEQYVAEMSSKFFTKRAALQQLGVTGVADPLAATGVAPIGARGRQAASGAPAGASSGFPLLNAITRVLSRKGRAEYDPATNSLVVNDTEPNIKDVEKLIEQMDIEPYQVFVDVKFISTDMTDRYRMGIDWASGINVSSSYGSVVSRLPFNLGNGGWEDRVGVSRDGPTAAEIAAGVSDFTDRSGAFTFGLLDFREMTTTLEMFKQDEGSELKQSPQLLVLDHEQATIFVGETIRFAETDSSSNQAGGVETGIREAAASPVDTGFQLLIRPHIVPGEDKVILTVIPKAESLSGTGETIPGFDDFTNGVASIQLPRVQSSTLVTKLILGDGQTAVLGGMIEEAESQTERRVPILGDIPILGWAFRWQSKLKSRNNLMIFLTVRIVRNGSDVKDIYTVYGSKHGGKAYKAMQAEAMSTWNKTKGSGYKDMATGDK